MFGQSPLEIMATQAMLQRRVFLQHFTYSASWQTGTATALGASGTVDVTTQVNADADFIVQEINCTSTTAVGTFLAVPDYLITMVLSGAGKQVMNQPQMVANVCGSYNASQVPAILSMPLMIVANSSIITTLANRTAVASNRVDVAFRGFKVFYQSGNDRQTIFNYFY